MSLFLARAAFGELGLVAGEIFWDAEVERLRLLVTALYTSGFMCCDFHWLSNMNVVVPVYFASTFQVLRSGTLQCFVVPRNTL